MEEVKPTELQEKQKELNELFGKYNYKLDEQGNAERFNDLNKHNIAYVKSLDKFITYDGNRWRICRSEDDISLINATKNVSNNILNEALNSNRETEKNELVKWYKKSMRQSSIKSMLYWAKGLMAIDEKKYDIDGEPTKMNLPNGVLDLKNLTIENSSNKYFITKLAGVSYEPSEKAPNWENFLKKIFNDDQQIIDFMQKLFGYSIIGDKKEQIAIVLYGTGCNGKSTLVEIWREMLKDYALQANFSTFNINSHKQGVRNDLARLKGARLVTAVESDEGYKLSDSIIKQLTGGDKVTARFLYQENFEFTPECLICLTTNHLPQIKGTDDGIWRRIVLIPFEVRIKKEDIDKELLSKLKQELSGILNWSLEGIKKYYSDGLQIPEKIINESEAYREEMNTIMTFIKEVCEIGDEFTISAKELYSNYQEWCKNNAQDPFSQKKVGTILKENNFNHKRGKGGNYYWNGFRIMN